MEPFAPRAREYQPDNAKRRVAYHSDAWALLVEMGWVTMNVDSDGSAVMLARHERASRESLALRRIQP